MTTRSILYRNNVNLPEPVIERLGDEAVERSVSIQQGLLLEARPWRNMEARQIDEASNVALIAGYSTTFDQPYDVYGGAEQGGWSEVMAPGSWAKTIREKDDLRFFVNHDGPVFARTSNGNLEVREDKFGVLNVVHLDWRTIDARDLYYKVERGDMREMSCAFRVTRQEWSPDYTERRILEVVGYDSSVVAYPANPNTPIVAGKAEPTEPAESAESAGRTSVTVNVENCVAVLDQGKRGMSVRAARLELDRLRRL